MTDTTTVSVFDRYRPEDVVALIREYPLAWVMPVGAPPEVATLLPLLPDVGETGAVVSLVGHMARRNPLMAALEAQPVAAILFNGPQAYVSPARVSSGDWAPTWNFAQVRIEARIRFRPEASGEALQRLLATMETVEPTGWSTAQLGGRYQLMEQAIIAFEADVGSLHARFKLGQDERPDTLREILERHPDADLVRWMRRMNTGRL